MTDEDLVGLSNHTPGPWAVAAEPGATWDDHGMRKVAGVGGEMVWIPKKRVRELLGRSKVNARLIAAAPQLLAELIEARRLLREAADHGLNFALFDSIRAFLDGEARK